MLQAMCALIVGEAECLVGVALPQDLDNSRCRLVMDCRVRTQEMQSHLHAVERVASPGKTNHSPYMPMRCVPREKITTQDKLLLAFDALVLWTVSGQAPRFGKIIHGSEQATAKVDVGWMDGHGQDCRRQDCRPAGQPYTTAAWC